MSKRLQLLLDEAEMREIRRAAREQQTTVSEWVRRALREARARQPRTNAGRRLEVVRAAARHEFPTADIGKMLSEIEAGYLHDGDA
jgi:Asp-tRNA(Asn)/Glu-tRNA(Gln) amidotransferase A subunit family amidase